MAVLGNDGWRDQGDFGAVPGGGDQSILLCLLADEIAFAVNVFHITLFNQVFISVANGLAAGTEGDRQHAFAGELIVWQMGILLNDLHQMAFNFAVNRRIHRCISFRDSLYHRNVENSR